MFTTNFGTEHDVFYIFSVKNTLKGVINMTYTNPILDMFERDRIKAYHLRKAKEQKEKEQEQIEGSWSPEEEPIMI